MVYVIPGVLPTTYAWKIQGAYVTDIAWVGARLNSAGELHGVPDEIPAAQSPAQARHHLLVGLTSVKAGIAILSQPQVRKESIAAIQKLLAANQVIRGIQLDFEYLPPRLANAFVSYIADLRQAISPTKVYAAVFPPVGMPPKWSAFHKLAELAEAADGLVVMLYDQHRPGTMPGCVSNLDWLDANIEALSALPRKKIWLGAPLYGYRFAGKKTTAISRKYFEKIAAEEKNQNGCKVKSKGNALAYYPAPELYERLEINEQQFTFAGVSYWRAGLE